MTKKKTMNEKNVSPVDFLADYAATILRCGATTVRTEKNVQRIACAYGYHAEINIYPRHVDVAVTNIENGRNTTRSRAIPDWGINFSTITALSRLSWRCHDRHPKQEIIMRQYQRIVNKRRISSPAVTSLTALANASFCRLFGGDCTSMAIVLVATACGFYLKGNLCSKWKMDARVSIFMAGCVSAILSCAGYVFDIGETPDVALATSVLYLVPGIHYLNAASDLINRHYICAICRFIHAGIMTICLSTGLYAAMTIMRIGITQ